LIFAYDAASHAATVAQRIFIGDARIVLRKIFYRRWMKALRM
jgi:hypothetical protein